MDTPRRLEIDDPYPFLQWIEHGHGPLRLDDVDVLQVWSLVALAALAGADDPPVRVDASGTRAATGFARALGIADIIAGRAAAGPAERGRTVKLTRLARTVGASPYKIAGEIAPLIVPDPNDDTRHTIYYVLVELLRNVVQHSRDPQGGIVAAQVMSAGRGSYQQDTVQVAVADGGIGIPEALRHFHPEHATDPQAALVRALDPHISGTFAPGLSGTEENAGLGLFFIAEMAKHAAGRLLISTRNATLTLEGSRVGRPQRITTRPGGYPGTLVAFEIPDRGVRDNHALLQTINRLAQERTPKRVTDRWLRYESAPEGTLRIVVSVAAEDAEAAVHYSQTEVEPRLFRKHPVALDFTNLPICTQSFIHALLYEALRLAWAKRVPIYIINAKPTVRSSLDLLESYALGG